MRAVIRRVLEVAAEVEAVPAGSSVGVLVCGDEEMRAFNKRFAGEDHTTDVLSFAVAPLAAGEPELGDIIMSLDRVKAQAAAAGHSDEREAATLAVHAFLHLLGFDHATREEEARMFARTDEILAAAGVR